MFVHTFYGDLYLGAAPLESITGDADEGKNIAPDLLPRVDTQGQLLANGQHHYLDWDGVAVSMYLSESEADYEHV